MTRVSVTKTMVGRGTESFLKTAAACIFIVGTMIGTALACPKGEATIPHLVVNQSEHVSVPTLTVFAEPTQPVPKSDGKEQGRCPIGCHCQAAGCSCCFGSVASNTVVSNLLLPAISVLLLPLDESEAASARPPPNFRPPRTFI